MFRHTRSLALAMLLAAGLLALPGCSIFPEVAHQPVVHNPFPQLTKVAVAPFFNLSSEPTVDGRQFALAYFNELQLIQGFEVIPVGVVEKTIQTYHLAMSSPEDARRLAQILGVDAVVIGAVTDFSPYYPPRCGLQIEWYAANPCFHPIPAGYGLPWGTAEEEYIPAPLVFEAELALAKAQLQTQTPPYKTMPVPPPVVNPAPLELPPNAPPGAPMPVKPAEPEGELTSHAAYVKAGVTTGTSDTGGTECNLPDGRAFIPAPPCSTPGGCIPTIEPVLRHTKTYNGHDAEVTEALASYYFFQDDARFGGWQAYLQRSDDFIRFCCRMHIYEMLSARGGAGETRVVWRWFHGR